MRKRTKNKLFAGALALTMACSILLVNPLTALAAINPPTIVIDPGHGGSEGGSTGNGLIEKNLNFKISTFAKQELDRYLNAKIFLTKTEGETVTLAERAERAKNYGASVLISMHTNSISKPEVNGAEVYVSNLNQYKPDSSALAQKILDQLTAMGLKSLGVKIRLSETGSIFESTGEKADYYGIINQSVRRGFPGLIVEHAFISNANDANTFLNSDEKLQRLARADANAIASHYGLDASPCGVNVNYSGFYEQTQWSETVRNGKQTGYPGSGRALTGFWMTLDNLPVSGDITYRFHGDNGWTRWYKSNESGYSDISGEWLEAVEISLTGEAADKYDVYYRVYAEGKGWLGWVKSGQTAGSAGYDYRLEDIQAVLVEKGAPAPGDTAGPLQQ